MNNIPVLSDNTVPNKGTNTEQSNRLNNKDLLYNESSFILSASVSEARSNR